MTYIQLIAQLKEIGASAPSHEAFEILRVCCGLSREWCLANRDRELPSQIESILSLRRSGVPLQYILGEAWFYGYRFIVNTDCLIPQPDTEHAVAAALKCLPPTGTLLDLCTGSGCIPIAVLNESPSASAVALEISKGAIAVAAKNANLHSVTDRLTIVEADVLHDDISAFMAKADVITSNPPYINTSILDDLPTEVRHEPRIALDGGADGMIFYRHFIAKLSLYMRSDAVMILEIGYDQADRITKLCSANHLSCKLHKDFGGNIRIAEIRKIK